MPVRVESEVDLTKIFQKTLVAYRRGIVDVWNAFMVDGADFDAHDIPTCPTTAISLPSRLISWPEAKRIHRKAMRKGDKEYRVQAFIHFYVDDVKFDGVRSSVWLFPWRALEIIRHFDGIITPDFSMCQDFPEPIKIFAVYRMRAYGFWAGTMGVQVINNVRWGSHETWGYCFAGVPKHTVVAVGAVASGLRKIENRPLFEDGLEAMIQSLKPAVVILYGSVSSKALRLLEDCGIRIVRFESDMSKAFGKGGRDE